ncbi:MAG: leucine-rich repeat domain-containing protein [Anaeroplasmataceae bacterium]|nr:leucine-rich repeat domain-containing protein [Anaeroplasmataceae bacterium]
MKKIKFVLMGIVTIFSIALMTSCGNNHHIHAYIKTIGNETGHWKECECGEKSDESSHIFGDWKNTKESTINEEGSKERECDVCHHKETETIPMLEHTHKLSEEWAIDVEPTCTEVGSKSIHCLVCDAKKYITEVPARGHFYSNSWTIDELPSCVKVGSMSYHCLNCNVTTDKTEIEALGHNYVDFICTRCEDKYYSKGLEYKLNSTKDSYSVVGKGTTVDMDIVIPETYNGLPVTNISSAAFFEGNLKSIKIPDSVTCISEYAFLRCTNLISIKIPDSVTNMENGAFMGCSGLRSVTIGKSITNIPTKAFYGCSNLTSITIPNNIKSIEVDSFVDCYRLVEIYNLSELDIIRGNSDNGNIGYHAKIIHSSLNEKSQIIEKDDFIFFRDSERYYLIGYKGLEMDLVLPMNIEDNHYYIDNYAFSGCKNLRNVEISDGVVWIGYHSFFGCEYLLNVTIGKNVGIIDSYAFNYCNFLGNVIISNYVFSIGEHAFDWCSSLRNIYYEGTLEEWNNVDIDEPNSILNSVAIYYYSIEKPTEEGNYWHYVNGVPTKW